MSENLEGQIKGINLTNFLQMVQMEKPTCTLIVKDGKKQGSLFIKDGEIIDADSASGHKHLDAAFEILSWDDPSIELKKTLGSEEKHINMPLMNLLMEAARFKDEMDSGAEEPEDEDAEISVDPDDIDVEDEDEELDLFPDKDGSYDDLDSISLEMEASDNLDTEYDGIPDEMLHKESSLSETDTQDQDSLENYDLGSEIDKQASVQDFTDRVALKKEKTDKPGKTTFEPTQKKKKHPSIEDYIEKKKPWKKRALLITAGIVILSSLFTGGYFFLKHRHISSEYADLTNNLKKMDYEEQKINLLKRFIKKYPDTKYSEKAESRIDKIKNRNQEESYNLLMEKIKDLEVNRKYREKALKHYNNFLDKFPKGKYADKVKEKIRQLPEVMSEYEFSKIEDIPDGQYYRKLKAINDFKENYPGKYSEKIKQILNETGTYYLQELRSELDQCTTLEKYNECIRKAENFKKLFPSHPDEYKAQRIIQKLEDDYWAEALINSAKKKHDSYEEEKKFLQNYISEHNRYSLTIAAQKRIREIDEILKEKDNFKNIMEYADKESYSLTNRINRLRAYRHSDIPEEYKSQAEKKLNELISLSSADKPSSEVKRPEKTDNTEDKQPDINQMLTSAAGKADNIKKQISGSDRFKASGGFSFTDDYTGKTWMLIDSDDFTNKNCHSYQEAKKLAEEIKADGYSDWRLPTEQELLTLFKNKPFFPVEKNRWYWSSTVFEKGFNTYSAAVSDSHGSKREELNKNINSGCGLFKLIRGE
ncbi:MAG: DUF4388 domain-containing protein [Thermodesulfobacteriota bacterium]